MGKILEVIFLFQEERAGVRAGRSLRVTRTRWDVSLDSSFTKVGVSKAVLRSSNSAGNGSQTWETLHIMKPSWSGKAESSLMKMKSKGGAVELIFTAPKGMVLL